MTRVPPALDDLHLAPLLLALDDRLSELAVLNKAELVTRVALDADRPDWTKAHRQSALLTTIERSIDCQGWQLPWAERGLRVAHDGHSVALRTPLVFQAYLDGSGVTAEAALRGVSS